MKALATLTGVLLLTVIWLPAEQAPAAKDPPTQPATQPAGGEQTTQPATASAPAGARSPEAEKVLRVIQMWQEGKKPQAIDLLLTVDWKGNVQFGEKPYILTMTERQFVSLTPADQGKVREEFIKHSEQWRALARETLQAGRAALAANDFSRAEAHYAGAVGLGRLLNRKPDGTLFARMVGIAIQKAALADLSALYQKTEKPENLRAIREELGDLEKQLEEIKRPGGGQ